MAKLVNHRRKDDAVSPVVGVMLMIVVTVVIAAVVALFASNVVTSTEAAPVVVMDMNAYYSGSSDDNTKLVMNMRGGEPLELSKLTVVLTESTGTYGFSVTGLDQKSTNTHLKVGEKLTVVSKADAKKSSNLITPVGGTLEEVLEVFATEYNVGKKVHVMVTFNENSIIYDKDIIVKAGAESTEDHMWALYDVRTSETSKVTVKSLNNTLLDSDSPTDCGVATAGTSYSIVLSDKLESDQEVVVIVRDTDDFAMEVATTKVSDTVYTFSLTEEILDKMYEGTKLETNVVVLIRDNTKIDMYAYYQNEISGSSTTVKSVNGVTIGSDEKAPVNCGETAFTRDGLIELSSALGENEYIEVTFLKEDGTSAGYLTANKTSNPKVYIFALYDYEILEDTREGSTTTPNVVIYLKSS